MAKKPMIKRIDRIGATAEIPYTRTLTYIKSQRWIADRFFRLMGRSCFFWDNPEEAVGAGVVRGSNYFDLKDTASRIKCVDEYPKENIRTAGRLEKLGKREEEAGHTETSFLRSKRTSSTVERPYTMARIVESSGRSDPFKPSPRWHTC